MFLGYCLYTKMVVGLDRLFNIALAGVPSSEPLNEQNIGLGVPIKDTNIGGKET